MLLFRLCMGNCDEYDNIYQVYMSRNIYQVKRQHEQKQETNLYFRPTKAPNAEVFCSVPTLIASNGVFSVIASARGGGIFAGFL